MENEYSPSHEHPKLPWDNFEYLLKVAIYNFYIESPFKYLVKNFPVRVDEKLSPYHYRALHETGSPAMCTGDEVGVDSENLYNIICHTHEEAEEVYTDAWEGKRVLASITSVLSHEYNHILLGHPSLKRWFCSKPRTEDELECFALAVDTIVNRGMGVDHDSPLILESAVTDKKLASIGVPGTHKEYTVMGVYNLLIKQLKESEKQFEKQAKAAEKLTEQAKQKLASIAKQFGDKASKPGASEKPSKSKGSGRGTSASAKRASVLDKMRATAKQSNKVPNLVPTKTVEQILGISGPKKNSGEAVPGTIREETEGKKIPQGKGEGNHGGVGGADFVGEREEHPEELLKRYNDVYEKQQVKKSLNRLRGIIQGELGKSKTKTYSRPPRRSYEGELMKKGVKRDKRNLPKILVALDSSGSMSGTTQKQVATTIANIVEVLGRDTKGCYICVHDGCVSNVNPLKHWRRTVSTYRACGGNRFSNVAEKAQMLGCEVVLNVGDGLDIVTHRDKSGTDQLIKSGLIWYDVIVPNGLVGSSDWRCYWDQYKHDAEAGYQRRLIDLTGCGTEPPFADPRT